MIQYEPIKVLFNIGSFTVYSWGFMFVIAFITAFFLMMRQAKKQGMDKKHIYNIALIFVVGAIVGARIFYCLEHLSFSLNSLTDHGGMTSYGGIFLALALAGIYIKKKKLNFGMMLDLIAPYLALAFAITRIGCFLNWCCYGISSNLPWAISVAGDIARHPTQIYLITSNLIIFSFLLYIRKIKQKKKFKILNKQGSVFFIFMMLYSLFRFFIDFFRVYELSWLGLALSQWICLVMLVFSFTMIVRNSKFDGLTLPQS